MGTRSLTYVYNDENKPVVCMYRQFDGYPEVHGKELAKFLNSRNLVNGLTGDLQSIANGMNCLAALMISHFKTEAGGIYLYPTDLDQDVWQEYEYHVYSDKVIIDDMSESGFIFEGNWKDFLNFCLKTEQNEC